MTAERIRFVEKYYPFARATWEKTGFPISSILAQSAIETGNGKTIVGNMMFGVKDTDGLNGNEQLLITHEQSTRGDLKFQYLIKKVQIGRIWNYTIKAWFRKYGSPEESFTDHARFITQNKRYYKALLHKNEPTYFSQEIARAGYATGVNYEKIFVSVTLEIYNYLKSKGYEQ